jgi:uncharacterized protein YndB with AHSA1/START domain
MRPTPEPVVTDRRHEFAHPPADVWAALTATERYPTWWRWLREFDGTDVSPGAVWRCAVRSPLGYTVRFRVTLDLVEAPTRVRASVSGDIDGTAAITLTPAPQGAGTELRITSHLVAVRPLLRRLTGLTPAIARWGHDRVMASGIESFRALGFHDR